MYFIQPKNIPASTTGSKQPADSQKGDGQGGVANAPAQPTNNPLTIDHSSSLSSTTEPTLPQSQPPPPNGVGKTPDELHTVR